MTQRHKCTLFSVYVLVVSGIAFQDGCNLINLYANFLFCFCFSFYLFLFTFSFSFFWGVVHMDHLAPLRKALGFQMEIIFF